MAYHVVMILLLTVSISGCSAHIKSSRVNEKKRLEDVYYQSIQDGHRDSNQLISTLLVEKESFGYVKPYVPVLEQPKVRKVWIPDQQSPDDPNVLIAGHWTYIMIQGPQWFTQQEVEGSSSTEEIIPSHPQAMKDN